MKVMISGHRNFKLAGYDKEWIKIQIEEAINKIQNKLVFFKNNGKTFVHDEYIGLCGGADGIDLWYLELLNFRKLSYHIYIPFDEQDQYMTEEDAKLRKYYIERAYVVKKCRNREMVEDCSYGIVVWDGNKGGTYNCFQQLIEKKKDIYWINPLTKTVNYINNTVEDYNK